MGIAPEEVGEEVEEVELFPRGEGEGAENEREGGETGPP